MSYVIPIIMIATGVIMGSLIGVGKVQQGALLLISPMIIFGVWILAATYVKRRNYGK